MTTFLDVITEIYIKPALSAAADIDLALKLNIMLLVCTVATAVYGLIFPAPYGRYSNRKFGSFLPTKISWMIQESPSALVPLFLLTPTTDHFTIYLINYFFVFLWIMHYVQRAFIQPLLTVKCQPTPFLVTVFALTFSIFNGYLQTFELVRVAEYNPAWLSKWNVIIGLFLFFSGMVINIYHDHLLRNMRSSNELVYKIPRGGLFRYVSCANYFGEIVEWWGFYLATCTYSTLIFALFSTQFLGLRALHHHNFYKTKFDDYPKGRKAVIPFVL